MKPTYSFYCWLSPRRTYAPWGVLACLITAVTSAPRTGPWLAIGAQWRPVKRQEKNEERVGQGETALIRKQKQALRSKHRPRLTIPPEPCSPTPCDNWKCPHSSPRSLAPQGLWMPSLLSFSRTGLLDFPGGPEANTLSYQCRGPRFDPWSGN